MTDETRQSKAEAVSHAGISDAEWSRRLGINCHHPDGGDQCSCPHYGNPKQFPDCTFKQLTTSEDLTRRAT